MASIFRILPMNETLFIDYEVLDAFFDCKVCDINTVCVCRRGGLRSIMLQSRTVL